MQGKSRSRGKKIVRIYRKGRIGAAISALCLIVCVALLCTSKAKDSYFLGSVDFYLCGDCAFFTRLEGENYVSKQTERGKLLTVQKTSSERILLGKDKEKAAEINKLYFYPLTFFSAVSKRVNEFEGGKISGELLIFSAQKNIEIFNNFYIKNINQIEGNLNVRDLFIRVLGALKTPPSSVDEVNLLLYKFAVAFTE